MNYLPNPKTSKIAVAMSGGVDSSAALAILKNLGYEVVGITAWIISGSGRCCDNGVIDAVKVCDQLGVEHHALDLRTAFAEGIIKEFHQSYARGETPIPCISCNNDVKWGSLLAYSVEKLGATHMASGHYAKLGLDNDSFTLLRPKETNKDQSYMLWGLNQEQLSRTVFPLADFTKEEVRAIAIEANLCVADKPESQDICFVSNGMTNSDYLTKILGEKLGDIVKVDSGEVLGRHNGSFNYTYGQRKGLGIAYSEPLYVIKIDPVANIVYVGTRDKMFGQKAYAKDRNIISKINSNTFNAMVKVRYNMEAVPATVSLTDEFDGTGIEIEFHEPVSAITPGQATAFYDFETGQELIGGAWIVGSEKSETLLG